MSEEKIVETEKKECNCFCKSEGFRKFLVTALGTFVGVYMALALFSAIHKPPMPCPCQFMHPAPMQTYGHFKHHGDFKKPDKKFHKEFKEFKKDTQPPQQENVD